MTVIAPVKHAYGNDLNGFNGRFHWTVDAFYRAIAANVFDDPQRYELVKGELWEREPMNPPHAFVARRIVRLLRRLFEPDSLVMEEKPVHLANDSEPRPDVCVVAGQEEAFFARHPEAHEILLLVEVADSSRERDTTEKALLYAQAGIADYWVSVVPTRELIVFRDPTPDGYQNTLRLVETDTVAPLCAPGSEIMVSDLLASPLPPTSEVTGEISGSSAG